MNILLTGSTGGIGSAILRTLKGHRVETFNRADVVIRKDDQYDWLIFAHGFIGEEKPRETFQANTLSHIFLTQDLLPHLKKGGGIIYISSTSGINGNGCFPIYSASKAAINGFAKAMAHGDTEHAFYALCPGPTATSMWKRLGLEGKPQSPNEVAKAIQQIMQGIFISGDIITVRDGKVWKQS